MNTVDIKEFLARANRAGYGNPDSKVVNESDASHTITFSENEWIFRDNYFGGEPFGGREVIFYKEKPVWMMTYYGGITNNNKDSEEIYFVLRKALLAFPPEMPLRGPDSLKVAGWEYKNKVIGDFNWFSGEETISYKGGEIYSAKYQGGLVDR